MRGKLFQFLILLCVGLSPKMLCAQKETGYKKLVEFGWDYPKVSYLKANLKSMQSKPFDGVVFSFDFDIYNAFDVEQRPEAVFQYDDLSKLQWKKFTDNFLFMRGVGISGAHWLDDAGWVKITGNLKKVSKAISVSKAKGVGFDPEYYYADSTLNPWVYRPTYYRNLSYEDVGAYVRKRGKQFIQALQTNKPDVQILCFWLLDLFDAQSNSKPAAQTGMALYPFFIEGIMDGINNPDALIDGNESSYWYQKPDNFIGAGEYLRDRGSKIVDGSLQSSIRRISIAQAVYFDWIYAKLPAYNKGFDHSTMERYLRENLYCALKSSDKYVWFYNERVNWWKGDVDPGVEEIIESVRKQMLDEQNNKSLIVSGNSLIFNFKENSSLTSYQGFHYDYRRRKNVLDIQLFDTKIEVLRVYENSRLIKEIKAPSASIRIDLDKKYDRKGNLIIISTDAGGITSVGYVN